MEPMGERGRQGATPLGGHTPGPWKVVPGDVLRSECAVVIDRDHLLDEPLTWPGLVADVGDAADARLIAAAPDLLEALERFLCPRCSGEGTVEEGDFPGRHGWNACRDCDGTGVQRLASNDYFAAGQARLVIAKARGEQ